MANKSLQETDFSDWGDFVESDYEVDVECEAEPLEGYIEGRYYPIRIGEILYGRYRVEHKLGQGGYSTVWMAYDLQAIRDVALKIIQPGDAGEREYRIQIDIIRTIRDTSHLVTCLDSFYLQSPRGPHQVLVFPLHGPTLSYRVPRMLMALRASAAALQLLQGLRSIHDSGIVHRGKHTSRISPLVALANLRLTDLSITNTLQGMRSLGNASPATKYRYLGRPQKVLLSASLRGVGAAPAWKEGELVAPMKVDEALLEPEFYLCDFGLAFQASTSVSPAMQGPAYYQAPERFHGAYPSYSTDMWSYMCIFAELCLGFTVFHRLGSGGIAEVVHMLGPLPEAWKGTYTGYGDWDSSWYDPRAIPNPVFSLETRVLELVQGGPRGKQLALSILQRGFSYSPEYRLSAAQLLEDASFREFIAMFSV